MSHSQKISSFNTQSILADTDLFTLVRNSTNVNVSFSDFKTSLGVTGTLNQVGNPLGAPTYYSPDAGINNFRNIESGAGIVASLSPQDGIIIKWIVAQDATGIPITNNLTNAIPDVSSLVAGSGMSITKTDNAITITNTVDPATGLSNRVVVTQASDFAGTLDSTKEYFIDGVVDMGSQSIEVPANGLSITGYSFDNSRLISNAAAYTMFSSPVGGSGNLLGRDYAIEVTGSGSKVYALTDATGFNAFEFSRINYNDCESLGTISGYRQGLEVGTGRFGGKPQLTLDGTWLGGYFIDTSIVRSLDDGSYSLFNAGATFVMNSRFRTNQNVDLPASASFINFSAVNIVNPSNFQLDGCIVTRNGVTDASDVNIIPNLNASELVSEWMGNNGINNTFVGGSLDVSLETLTTITSAGVFTDLLGGYSTNDLSHFDSPSSGQLRHLGDSPIEYLVTGQYVIESTAGDELDLKVVIFRDATTSFEDGRVLRRVVNNLQGGRDVAYFVLQANITLNKNDYVKLQVANVNSINNVTAELDSYFNVKAR